jgi:predicted Zn finger-like uncharacterized protein
MIDSFVTQCPQCRTSFRVSRAQLGIANGVVRCGACLHVFNAAQQLLSEQPGLIKPAAPAKTPTPALAPSSSAPATSPDKPPTETLWIHDDLDLDSLDLDEALAQLEEQEHQLSTEFLALARAPMPAEQFLKASEPSNPYNDDWAEKLLSNTPASAPAGTVTAARTAKIDDNEKPATPTAPESTPAMPEPKPEHKSLSTAPIAEPTIAGTYAFLTDSSALELEAPEKLTAQSAQTPLHAEREEPTVDETADEDKPQDEEPPAAQATHRKAQTSANNRQEPGLRNEGLLNLAQEPLQLDWRQPKKTWWRKAAWLLINLAALAALSGQYISYHFAELARQDRYRPWFAEFCPNLGCTLPSKVEISLIKSSNLVVRSHPDFSGALVVDAILYNRAAFSQPFPLLELRFADASGKLLASRSFKPSEYLAGELAGQDEMPPQTPIHIALDILDPGIKAVNYSLSFHSPE